MDMKYDNKLVGILQEIRGIRKRRPRLDSVFCLKRRHPSKHVSEAQGS